MRYALSRVKRLLLQGLMVALRVFPLEGDKVLIVSYYGGGYGDNGKAIAEALHQRMPELRLFWAVKPGNEGTLPDFITPVGYRTLAYYYHLATAAVWVDNSRKDPEILKRKGQYYIQTWHGTVSLKRIEADAAPQLSRGYLDSARQDSRMADVILSGCGFFTDLCRRAFWYEGEILECGSPRLDGLFRSPDGRVKERLGVPMDRKLLLYAPTFRADGNTACYLRNFEGLLDALEKRTGEKWAAAVRLHPNVADRADFIPYSGRVVNATGCPDLYELLPAAELVITDYSSLMFEAALMEKPVVLYAQDLESYAGERNFYFDLGDLPFPLCRREDGLPDCLRAFDRDAYLEKLKKFNSSLSYWEKGTAAKAVAERVRQVLGR